MDRRHAVDDRLAASADRAHAAQEIADLLVDATTGAHVRDSGLMELQREVMQAHRTHTPFVLAFVDVDGLKERNDAHGHAAGDEVLRLVVQSIRRVVREYDVIIRFGGDEFVCGLTDLPLAEAGRRFDLATADLGATHGASFSVGVVELQPEESLDDLLARADAAMYDTRGDARSRPT